MTKEQLEYLGKRGVKYRLISTDEGYKINFVYSIKLSKFEEVTVKYESNYSSDYHTIEGLRELIDEFIKFIEKHNFYKIID